MSICQLLNEILQYIFGLIGGRDVFSCRAVCRNWRAVADGLPDSAWRQICQRLYYREEYSAARDKYGLSWRDSYKALNSWANIHTADMDVHQLQLCHKMTRFKVLPNELLACLRENEDTDRKYYTNEIVYYDLKTFKICGKVTFDFFFSSKDYDENENFHVLTLDDLRLCILLKKTKKKYFVGKVAYYYNSLIWMEKDKIYFLNEDESIYVAKLAVNDREPVICTDLLFENKNNKFESDIVNAVALNRQGDKINIITIDGDIYTLKGSTLKLVRTLNIYQTDAFEILQSYNFNWRSDPIWEYIMRDRNIIFAHKKHFFDLLYAHGPLVIVSKVYEKIHNNIYYYPYIIFGMPHLIKLVAGKPKRTICSNSRPELKGKMIQQLDIVETGDCHKAILLEKQTIYVLEFKPNNLDPKRLRSRKLNLAPEPQDINHTKHKIDSADNINTKKAKRCQTKKLVQAKPVLQQHRYPTRSSTKL